MLVYLFFVFTCGWCVCWLLFLNYQQHSRDSIEPPLDSASLEDDPGSYRVQQLPRRKRKRESKQALLVRHSGRHEPVKTELQQDDELESGRDDKQCCPECRASLSSELVLDWPVNKWSTDDDAESEHEQPEVAQQAWPLVELHENLLGGSEQTVDVSEPSFEQTLDRSRLLSLQPSQLSHRAAIRQVSIDELADALSLQRKTSHLPCSPALLGPITSGASQPVARSKLDYQARKLACLHAN